MGALRQCFRGVATIKIGVCDNKKRPSYNRVLTAATSKISSLRPISNRFPIVVRRSHPKCGSPPHPPPLHAAPIVPNRTATPIAFPIGPADATTRIGVNHPRRQRPPKIHRLPKRHRNPTRLRHAEVRKSRSRSAIRRSRWDEYQKGCQCRAAFCV